MVLFCIGEKMKYHVSVTKKEVITAILFIIGLIFLFRGIHSAYRYSHARSLEALDNGELKEGTYVTGSIDSYIGQIMYGSNRFYGVSQTYITLGKSYDFYTVPVGPNSYIILMISDESVRNRLDAFDNGHGDNVYFEGIISEPITEPNYAWYEYVEDFNTEDLITSFVIKEANLKGKNTTYLGFLLMVIASLIFFSSGGIKDVVIEETNHSKPAYNNYAKLYNKDNELQAEKMQLQVLEKRLLSMKRTCMLCPLILGLGIYMIYQFHLILGTLLLFISVRNAWRYFINSSGSIAVSLASKISVKSLSLQIEELKKNLEDIEKQEEKR